MIHWLRHSLRLLVLGLSLWVGFAAATGLGRGSVEAFCPMGAVAALPAVVKSGHLLCSVGEAALAALAALALLTLLARKSFCSWLCPLGAVLEWVGRLGAWLRGRKAKAGRVGFFRPPEAPDGKARYLRLGVLATVVAGTVTSAELVFRPFCPYYTLTSFHGHDVELWSYGLLALVLAAALLLPLAWCRYFCPLGGTLWPLSRIGLLRIGRRAELCNDCGLCDRACPQGLHPSRADAVRSGECTLCLECKSACPLSETLSLQVRQRRLPDWSVPALAGGLSLLAVFGSGWFWIPTYTWKGGGRAAAEVSLEVDGVTCAHTARLAASQLEGLEGVVNIKAYASRHMLKLGYDPARTDPARLRAALEAPLVDKHSGVIRFGVFKVRRQMSH